MDDFFDYRLKAMRTLKPAPTIFNPLLFKLLHAVLGITSELGELYAGDSDRDEEFGDLWWYTALGAHELGIGDLPPHEPSDYSPLVVLEPIITAIKAGVIYNKPLPWLKEEWVDWIAWMRYNDASNYKMHWEQNIAKLKKRYPEKYTDTDAVERKDKQ